jgi:hypothetical protein
VGADSLKQGLPPSLIINYLACNEAEIQFAIQDAVCAVHDLGVSEALDGTSYTQAIAAGEKVRAEDVHYELGIGEACALS